MYIYNKITIFRFVYERFLFMVEFSKRTMGGSPHPLEKYFPLKTKSRSGYSI